LLDIVRWNRDQPDRRSPRREWARDYWQAAPAAEEVDETAVQAPTTPTSI
jgi:hypothetical protein